MSCDICGGSGLVSIERTDGCPVQARVGGELRELRSAVASCLCPAGADLRAKYADPKGPCPWPDLAGLPDEFRPVGGWPGGHGDPDAPLPRPVGHAVGAIRGWLDADRGGGKSQAEQDRDRGRQLEYLRGRARPEPAGAETDGRAF